MNNSKQQQQQRVRLVLKTSLGHLSYQPNLLQEDFKEVDNGLVMKAMEFGDLMQRDFGDMSLSQLRSDQNSQDQAHDALYTLRSMQYHLVCTLLLCLYSVDCCCCCC